MKVCKRGTSVICFLVEPLLLETNCFKRDLRLPFCGSHDCELGHDKLNIQRGCVLGLELGELLQLGSL